MNANNIDPHIKSEIMKIVTLVKDKDDKYKEALKKYIEHQLKQIIPKEIKNNNWRPIKNTLKYSTHEVIDTVTTAIIDMVRTGQIDKQQIAVKAGLKVSAVLAKALCDAGGRCLRRGATRRANNGGRTLATTINVSKNSGNSATRRRKV